MCITLAKCTGHTTGQGVTRFEQLKSSQALANDDTDFISKEGKTEPTPTFQGKTQAELGPTRTNPPSNRNQGRTAKRRKLKLSSERVDLADNQSTRSSETDSLNSKPGSPVPRAVRC